MSNYNQNLKFPASRYPIGMPVGIDPADGYRLIQNLKKHKRLTMPKSGSTAWILLGFVEKNNIPYRLTHIPNERYMIEIAWEDGELTPASQQFNQSLAKIRLAIDELLVADGDMGAACDKLEELMKELTP